MTIKVNIIEKLPGDKTIRLEDFVKVLHPTKRVWQKVKLVREKKDMGKTILSDIRVNLQRGDLEENEFLAVEFYLSFDCFHLIDD